VGADLMFFRQFGQMHWQGLRLRHVGMMALAKGEEDEVFPGKKIFKPRSLDEEVERKEDDENVEEEWDEKAPLLLLPKRNNNIEIHRREKRKRRAKQKPLHLRKVTEKEQLKALEFKMKLKEARKVYSWREIPLNFFVDQHLSERDVSLGSDDEECSGGSNDFDLASLLNSYFSPCLTLIHFFGAS